MTWLLPTDWCKENEDPLVGLHTPKIYWLKHHGGLLIREKTMNHIIKVDPVNYKREDFEDLDKSEGYKLFVERDRMRKEAIRKMMEPFLELFKSEPARPKTASEIFECNKIAFTETQQLIDLLPKPSVKLSVPYKYDQSAQERRNIRRWLNKVEVKVNEHLNSPETMGKFMYMNQFGVSPTIESLNIIKNLNRKEGDSDAEEKSLR